MEGLNSQIFLQHIARWPFLQVLGRMSLAVVTGIFIGLEREHSKKTGVRTFALVALLGCLGGMMGELFAALGMAFVALIIIGINYREMVRSRKLVITTSAAVVVAAFAGILFGQGHLFTPAVAAVITAALLAWKRPISEFALGLSDTELRSAILLAILTVVVLPILPDHPVDPWNLVQPRENWLSVVIIAAIGFVNYILMKTLGVRGMMLTAFFGGLVNSRKVIVELGLRLREAGDVLISSARLGMLLATAAMIIRNAVIVAVFALPALADCAVPLAVMLVVNAAFCWKNWQQGAVGQQPPVLSLESPFKLGAALKFGLVFLLLNVIGALAQRRFGAGSFYFVSIAGGLLSSASSIASAATLVAHHELPQTVGANGVMLSTITSVVSNLPLIRGMVADSGLRKTACAALLTISGAGLAAGILSFAFQRMLF